MTGKDQQLIYEAYAASQESKCQTDQDGTKRWYNNQGSFHREDGPAVEYPDGQVYWCLNNHNYSIKSWAEKVLKRRGQPHDETAVNEFLRPILAKQTKDSI